MKKIKIINEELFKIGKYEFIKFTGEDGSIIGVLKDSLYEMQFGETNDFSESDILARLNKEFLPKIKKLIGEENLLEFETDLTAINGSKEYGRIKSKVSLPTFDFFRSNRAIFDKYQFKDKDMWWLATPYSTKKYYCNHNVACVWELYNSIDDWCADDDEVCVRPIMHFSSSIFQR